MDGLQTSASQTEFDSLLGLFATTLSKGQVTYIAIPITTGRRFLNWWATSGLVECDENGNRFRVPDEIRKQNEFAASSKVAMLRHRLPGAVLDPTQFEWPGWSQDDYRFFWGKVIDTYVQRVILTEDWQFSNGCAYECLCAVRKGLSVLDETLMPLSAEHCHSLLKNAIAEMNRVFAPTEFLSWVFDELDGVLASARKCDSPIVLHSGSSLKDETLNDLAERANIAQFISFGPGKAPEHRFSRMHGITPNSDFSTLESAIYELLKRSSAGSVNVRSFDVPNSKGQPFVYGLKTVEDVVQIVKARADEGRFSIVNETIDIQDGGVSGVIFGDTIEFSPEDTPKCVDKPGVCSMERHDGLALLQMVYNFVPDLDYPTHQRVEFSLHPVRCGIRHTHTLVWEIEEMPYARAAPGRRWPNRFSNYIGDKTFGLLIAHQIGVPVPFTTVISRHIAPFTFGLRTHTNETWTRTCPTERTPGFYATIFGWRDPFSLVSSEENRNLKLPRLAAVLAQESVEPAFSGGCLRESTDSLVVEGVVGRGDAFMLGQNSSAKIPSEIHWDICELSEQLWFEIGSHEFEWVHDGKRAWVVQLHQMSNILPSGTKSDFNNVLVPGIADEFIEFKTEQGLEALRGIIVKAKEDEMGICLVGDVGITSHFGDLLRTAQIPSRIKRK